jgi:hypothetical protein
MSFAKRSKDRKLPPFVALPWSMLNGRAYQSLKHSAAKALPYFWGKPKRRFDDPALHEIEIKFPYEEGARYGFASGTFSKIIQELVAKGFLDPVDKGGLRSFGKSWNVFKISRRWEKYGTAEYQAVHWKCFVPRPRLKATAKRETNSFKKGNEKEAKSSFISRNEVVEIISS